MRVLWDQFNWQDYNEGERTVEIEIVSAEGLDLSTTFLHQTAPIKVLTRCRVPGDLGYFRGDQTLELDVSISGVISGKRAKAKIKEFIAQKLVSDLLN